MTAPLHQGRLLAEILTEHGPLHDDDLTQHLRAAGVTEPAGTLRRLRLGIDVPARQLIDGRWVWLPTVLAGRVFTRRITEFEANFDLLTITPDLEPMAALCGYPRYQRLADGSPIQPVAPGADRLLDQLDIPPDLLDDEGALALAVGTFEALGVDEGDLVGLRLSSAGLVVERVSTAAATTAGAQLAALLGEWPRYVGTLVWTACDSAPTLFTEATAPLSEIAADRGLAQRGEWLAPPDFDFRDWDFLRGCARLKRRHRLDSTDAIALNTLLGLAHGMTAHQLRELALGEDVTELEASEFDEVVVGALADPAIAEALAVETAEDGRGSAAGLRLLTEVLAPKVPPSAQAACQWLRAVAMERDGDIAGSERALLAAEALDGDWPPALRDLARIASDRGDVEAGLALLRRAGAPANDPLVYLLRRHRCKPRTDLGRNQPCWCGSGRKYKKCHLHRSELSLPDRVAWLYHKAIQHVLYGDWTDLRYAVAWARCRRIFADDDAFNAALADPVAIDAILSEGGGFDEFLKVRGPLLPEDERALVEKWLLVERSVFEIECVEQGGSITARDVRTGERHEADEHLTRHPLQAGQLVCARVAPDGAGMRFFGLEPISAQQRDPLLALLNTRPDPVELVAQLSDDAGDADSSQAAPRSA